MRTAIFLGVLALGATAAVAQQAPATKPAAAPEAKPNVVVLAQGKTIEQAAADWAKAASATVVVDPAITGNVTAATAKLPLEQGLSAVAQAQHAEWRRAYLKSADIPKKTDGTIDPVRLREIVESASSVPNVSVGVLDPATGMIAMSTRANVSDPGTQTWLKDRVPVYILYRPAIVGSAVGRNGDPVQDYLATQRNSMQAFRSMTPEQRAEATRQGLDMVLNMDPEIMAQMARESMQALQNLSPEQKAKLMDMSMKMMSGGQNQPPAQ